MKLITGPLCPIHYDCRDVCRIEESYMRAIDNLYNRLVFIYTKKSPGKSKIAKFGGEMLKNVRNIQRCKVCRFCI